LKREPSGSLFFCHESFPHLLSKRKVRETVDVMVMKRKSNSAGKRISKIYKTFAIQFYTMSIVKEFNDYREKMNEVILKNNNLVMKRLWNLDTNTYDEGVLDKKTKEMLGLVSSMVLRCDDCIKYHLGKCHELGLTTPEVYEIFSVANIVGGTIVIPHTRRAAEYWEALHAEVSE
jgi:AhpD family alkylhydroperoxidase